MSIGDPGLPTQPSSSNASDLSKLGLSDEQPMDEETSDLLMIARSLYDAKEHERVAYLLRFVKHPKARFLGLYSRYIVCMCSTMGGCPSDVWIILSLVQRKEGSRRMDVQKRCGHRMLMSHAH